MARVGFASMSIRGRAGPIPASTGKGSIKIIGLDLIGGGLGLVDDNELDSVLMGRNLGLKSTTEGLGLVLALDTLSMLLLLL